MVVASDECAGDEARKYLWGPLGGEKSFGVGRWHKRERCALWGADAWLPIEHNAMALMSALTTCSAVYLASFRCPRRRVRVRRQEWQVSERLARLKLKMFADVIVPGNPRIWFPRNIGACLVFLNCAYHQHVRSECT